MPLRADGTTTSEHVFEDAGRWWFDTEDESSIGPYATADEADDAFTAYCDEVLGEKRESTRCSPTPRLRCARGAD